MKPLKSRIPGSLEYLEEDEEGFAPIDDLLYWIEQGSFEQCQFKYGDKWYLIHCDAGDNGEIYHVAKKSGLFSSLFSSPSVVEVLDAPCLPGGVTARQALSNATFFEYQNI